MGDLQSGSGQVYNAAGGSANSCCGRSPCNILQLIYEIGELQMTEELW